MAGAYLFVFNHNPKGGTSMKKTICLLLSVILLVSILALPAAADTSLSGQVVIISTYNIRGNIDVYPYIAALYTHYLYQGADDVILIDLGNFLQGTRYANFDRGQSVYRLMNIIGYDVAGMDLAEFSYTDATTGYPYH